MADKKFPASPIILSGLLIVVILAGIEFYLNRNTSKSSSTVATATTSPSTKATATASPASSPSAATTPTPTATAAANSLAGKIVITTVGNNFTQYLFNPTTKEVEKTTKDIGPADYQNGGYGSSDNDVVQVASNGDTYYYESVGVITGDAPAPAPGSSYTEIRRAPNKVIFHQSGNDVVAGDWIISKDGSKLYVALPAATGTSSDLYVIDTTSLVKRKVASLGVVSTPLVLSADGTQLLVGEDRKRVEGNEYHDYYTTIVNLATGSTSQKLLWKDRDDNHFPFFELDSLVFGPKLLKTVGFDSSNGVFSLHAVNLSDAKESDLYLFKAQERGSSIVWSPDGLQVLFGTGTTFSNNAGAASDQGLLVYNFDTNKTTQIFTTNIEEKDGAATGGDARPVSDSFDGKSFVYNQDDSIYYYDIALAKKFLITADAKNVDQITAIRP